MHVSNQKNHWITLSLIMTYALFAGLSFQFFHESTVAILRGSYEAHLWSLLIDGSYIVLTALLIVCLGIWLLRMIQSYEQALRQSEERYRNIVESIPEMIWESNILFEYTFVSQTCNRMLGCTPDESRGKTPFYFMPPEMGAICKTLYAKYAKDGKPIRALEVEYQQSGKAVVNAEVNAVPIVDAQGEVCGYRGIDRDITRRKQAERISERTNEFYRLLFDEFPLPLWRAGTDGRISYLNIAATELLVIPLAELGHFDDAVYAEDRHRYTVEYQQAINARTKFTLTYRLRDNQQQPIQIIHVGVPFWADEDTFVGFIGYFIDSNSLAVLDKFIESPFGQSV